MDTEVRRAQITLARAGFIPLTDPGSFLPAFTAMLEANGYVWLAYSHVDRYPAATYEDWGRISRKGLATWIREFRKIHSDCYIKFDGGTHCSLDGYDDLGDAADELGNGSLWGVEHGMSRVILDPGDDERAMVRGVQTYLYWCKP